MKFIEGREWHHSWHSDQPLASKANPSLCIQKGWGRSEDGLGEYFAYHQPQEGFPLAVETVKILYFAKDKKLSRHFHVKKTEYFILIKGCLKIELWDRVNKLSTFKLSPLDKILIRPGWQHRMTGLEEENILLEVSTLDHSDDSFRIEKGD